MAVSAAALRFGQLVRERLGPQLVEVRVFGSRARGDYGPESDLDVFVMVDGDEGACLRPVVAAATEVMREQELPYSIAPLVMSRAHFQELRRRELRIARDIVEEGVPL